MFCLQWTVHFIVSSCEHSIYFITTCFHNVLKFHLLILYVLLKFLLRMLLLYLRLWALCFFFCLKYNLFYVVRLG